MEKHRDPCKCYMTNEMQQVIKPSQSINHSGKCHKCLIFHEWKSSMECKNFYFMSLCKSDQSEKTSKESVLRGPKQLVVLQ